MKKILFLLTIPLLVVSCNAQNTKSNQEKEQDKAAVQPKVDVQVNKVYDENGNLVGYDSTYVWSYTNEYGNTVDVDIDSVLSQLRPLIGMQYPDFFNNHYNGFLGDSLFYQDFLSPDYFMNRWQQQMHHMNRMMYEMDSIKQLFLQEEYPGLEKQER
ncbi:MAG: hypothetical protein L3J66_01760 [Bacteroidales bacterium]|nr:hypothetical protein [Bacteroidales bacterium]